jgi:hypothetical protein
MSREAARCFLLREIKAMRSHAASDTTPMRMGAA